MMEIIYGITCEDNKTGLFIKKIKSEVFNHFISEVLKNKTEDLDQNTKVHHHCIEQENVESNSGIYSIKIINHFSKRGLRMIPRGTHSTSLIFGVI